MQPMIVQAGQRITVEYDVTNAFSPAAKCGTFWIKDSHPMALFPVCAQPPHGCLGLGQSTGCNATYIVSQDEIDRGAMTAAAFAVVIGPGLIEASNTCTFVIGRAIGVGYLPLVEGGRW